MDYPAAAANPRGCEAQPHLPRDRFQPNADASSLCFATMCCTAADHKAAVHAILHAHAIQVHDVMALDDAARIVAAVQQGGLQ
jgi:hypothetical protein